MSDEEFQELAVKVEGLSSRVRTLEDDRAIDRAEAQVRHRALIDSMQALRVTQVEQGRDIARLRTEMKQGFANVDRRFAGVDEHLGGVQATLAHLVRLLGGEQADAPG